ncbi:hypothetical protein VNO77_17977 [Canavalia gladiata]|uniref:Uncharacterized protein n=1 Tax=Canavalia gladiata TaxID=3824 RepID=A0AAN9LJX1_CANGL
MYVEIMRFIEGLFIRWVSDHTSKSTLHYRIESVLLLFKDTTSSILTIVTSLSTTKVPTSSPGYSNLISFYMIIQKT